MLMGVGYLIRGLPRSGLLRLGRRLGDFIYFCVPIRKALALKHLQMAFPEKTESEIKGIARGAYQNFGMNVAEHLCLPMLSKADIRKIVHLPNEDILIEALAREKGVIFVGGHFGNWEYSSCSLPANGYRCGVVVAQISNPYIDKKINEHRKATGGEMIAKGTAARSVMKILRDNGTVGMLMDQDENEDGIFVDFFGRPCSTAKGPASIAVKTEAAMIFFAAIRQEDGSIKVTFELIEIDYQKGLSEENIKDITQRATARLEHYTRLYPDHWFWMHRRWKTRPGVPYVRR
jgi:KDO2-lipid IV(A) lauroyltransferase